MGLSIALATGLYGLSFGALSVAAGLSVWQTQALSLLMFTGGSQFAFIGVMAVGGRGDGRLCHGRPRGCRISGHAQRHLQGLAPRWGRIDITPGQQCAQVLACVLVIHMPCSSSIQW